MAKSKGFKTSGADQGTVDVAFAEGHRLHGLTITLQKRVPIGVILAGGDATKSLPPLLKRIVAWNLMDDDDQPIVPSVEAFGDNFDIEETNAIIQAWSEAMTGPSGPLEQRSNGTSS